MTTKNNFDVLLFDLGGVLIDFAGFDELGRLMPGAPDRGEIRERWINSESVQRFERGHCDAQLFARGVIDELQIDLEPGIFLSDFVGWARGPYPGARSLLEQITSGIRVACLSNSNELHTAIHRNGVEDLFEEFYFSNEIGMVKPDREIYEFVVRDLGVPAPRIAFFDDTSVNVQAARGAGLTAFEVDGIKALGARLHRLGLLEG